MFASYLNSYECQYFYDTSDPAKADWTAKGNMSEAAIVVGAAKCRFTGDDPQEYRKTYARNADLEVPFSSARKMSATIHKLSDTAKFLNLNLSLDDKESKYSHLAIVKGAPDRLFEHVKNLACVKDGQLTIDDAEENYVKHYENSEIEDMNRQFSEQALRVLAVCIKPLTDGDMTRLANIESTKDMPAAEGRLQYLLKGAVAAPRAAGEPVSRAMSLDGRSGNLTLLGLLGALDPPRPGVQQAVERCRDASVRVVMITGDQKNTACAIARNISILTHGDTVEEKVIVCADLHHDDGSLIEESLIHDITRRVNVFSRAQPEDKMVIVKSLQKQGEVVAMTGDGVNDAPALQCADIGVAMGITGTDVAQGASDMILSDDNFCTLAVAVEEGRKIYSNIQKFVCFLLGTNIGEIFYLTVAVLGDLPLPVFGIQVLFLNLFTDGGPAVALTMEPADEDIMDNPPRDKKANIMTFDCMWWINMPHQLGICAMVIGVTIAAMYMHTGEFHQTKIEKLCEYMTDESWKAYDPDECVSANSCPYYCMCRRWQGSKWDVLETGAKPYAIRGKDGNWVLREQEGESETFHFKGGSVNNTIRGSGWTFDEWLTRQNAETFFKDQDPAPWPISTFDEDKISVSHVVMITKDKFAHDPEDAASKRFKEEAKKINDDNCMVEGIKLGRSTAFITAVMCEMLRAYTVRSIRPAIEVFNRNKSMHIACLVSFCATCSLTLIPGVMDIFKLGTPRWFYYFIAFVFAFCCMVNDEHAKFWYRRQILRRREKIAKAAHMKSSEERIESIAEMLHNLTLGKQKADEDIYDIKETLGQMTRNTNTTGSVIQANAWKRGNASIRGCARSACGATNLFRSG